MDKNQIAPATLAPDAPLMEQNGIQYLMMK